MTTVQRVTSGLLFGLLLALGGAGNAFADRNPPPTATPCPCEGCASKVCVCTIGTGSGSTSMTVPGDPDKNGSCAYLNGKDGQHDCSASCPPDNSEPSGDDAK